MPAALILKPFLLGAETWVALPENRWPKHWKGKFYRPVVKIVLALYGHADAGGFWEAHCTEKLLSMGLGAHCRGMAGCLLA